MDPKHPSHSAAEPLGAEHLVPLDRNHPGFRDREYRTRRDAIARMASSHRRGDEVPRVAYTDDEHGVWRTVWRELDPLHARLACDAYRRCASTLRLDRERIPQLADVSAQLAPRTGFRLMPVAGLVLPEVFLGHLGEGYFLSTQYMRHHSAPLYTPEPDVIHELVGHAVTLVDPGLARLNALFGEALARGRDVETLTRVYWYSLEFGVVREEGTLRAYGAGLLSSFGELGRVASHGDLHAFDIDAMAQTPFDPTDYQQTLFVAESLDSVVSQLTRWLDR